MNYFAEISKGSQSSSVSLPYIETFSCDKRLKRSFYWWYQLILFDATNCQLSTGITFLFKSCLCFNNL